MALTKKQQLARKQKQLQDQAAQARLLKQVGRSPTGRVRKGPELLGVVDTPTLRYDADRGSQRYKSAGLLKPLDFDNIERRALAHMTEEQQADWLQREAAAAEEIEVKKRRVAPAYNKGGYVYITEGTNPHEIGSRKI